MSQEIAVRLRPVAAIVVALVLAAPALASEPGQQGVQCRDWGFQQLRQTPSEGVLDVVRRLVKRTNTTVTECAPSMAALDPKSRICGVTEMPEDKFRSRVESVFDLLGPSLRDPWRDRSGMTVGGFYFLDASGLVQRPPTNAPMWIIAVSTSPAAQLAVDSMAVAFTICGSGVAIQVGK